MDQVPNMPPEAGPNDQPVLAPAVIAGQVEGPVRAWSIVGQLVIGLLLAVAACFALMLAAGFFMGFGTALQGGKPDPADIGNDVMAFMVRPTGMSLSILLTEAVFLGVALFGVRRLTGAKLDNLGLRRPAIPWFAYPLFAAGSAAVAAFGEVLATPINELIPSTLDTEKLCGQVTWATGIPFVTIITLAPGFVEELLCRGYVQRRLLRRWRPWSAILFASVAFAVLHLDPTSVASALPGGIWLGILAWRTGSIWPGVAGHMFVNALWNIWGICVQKLDISEDSANAAALVAAACALVGLVGSVVLLVRMRTRAVVLAQPAAAPDSTVC